MAALKQYSDIAYDYMEWFSNILKENEYTLHIESVIEESIIEPDRNLTGYYFKIKYSKNNEDVGVMQTSLYPTPLYPNSYYTSLLRSKKNIPAHIISIANLVIYEKFKNIGIATKLLLAALCYTYVNVPDIYTHVTVDDVTDSNIMSMDKNIYSRLGFVPIGLVALANSKKEMIPIRAGTDKIQTIDHIFKAIIPIKKIPIKKIPIIKKGGKRSKKRRHTICHKHNKRRNTRK